MTHTILEYIWLDGYDTPNLRSKIKAVKDWNGEIPDWNFDGSSTEQADGDNSECILSPVRVYNGHYHHYVLCEVLNIDGTPHESNRRALLENKEDMWFGFEQEYFITEDKHPVGHPKGGYPDSQGLYYCGVGGNQVRARELVVEHMEFCHSLGIDITGVNAEVALGQWEYQCLGKGSLKACDDLWMSRYLLYKLAEEYGYDIDITPKPVRGDWNGSGCHANFSNDYMRNVGDKSYFDSILVNLGHRHKIHIGGYGVGNEYRLTGNHETQHISEYSYGIADRGASIRIPNQTVKNGWCGYLEDRRPASNCDPYRVAKLIMEAFPSAHYATTS